ncbi:ribonucleotide reductase subunit 2 [Psittacid alphaherpesvirus 5]|uniref:ribonucleoside-diphosphate reductase n=1 Tax=Psittacid alphaherpesvirus 5 TaxID=2972693 RepID=A0A5P9JP68_9ALPH|nr:ribonucleotide reductase subunit 2 [Psittacid alphaherpesvirus 5]QFU14577.1 ribonucleotide reductase subunit 2 [Psittacid alphaherpesvirus 5]UOO01048.1 ribonucleotide reductase subunit 2 [Psittacid alphaherpesvirus 5]
MTSKLFSASAYYYLPECDDIRALRDLSIANNWNDFELRYDHDEVFVSRLTTDELEFYKFVYAFLSAADDLVNINIESLLVLFPQKDIQHYYIEQMRIETVHSRTYSQIQLLLFKGDLQARDEYVAVAIQDPAIKRKIDWLKRIQRETELTLPEKYIIMILIEGIFFVSSFASIAFLRGHNLFTVMCQSNELISRDEAIHTTASCYIYNNWLGDHPKPEPARVRQLFKEAVEIECDFLVARAPRVSHLIDLPAIQSFVRYSGDRLLLAINMSPLYNEPAPSSSFPLALMPIEKHVNFFERRNTAYSGNIINDL